MCSAWSHPASHLLLSTFTRPCLTVSTASLPSRSHSANDGHYTYSVSASPRFLSLFTTDSCRSLHSAPALHKRGINFIETVNKLRKEGRRKSDGEMMDRLDMVYKYQRKRSEEKEKEEAREKKERQEKERQERIKEG